jgi:hypothetical protein
MWVKLGDRNVNFGVKIQLLKKEAYLECRKRDCKTLRKSAPK